MNKKYLKVRYKLLILLVLVSASMSVSADCAYNYRYQDNGDGTASNLQYGLMWQRCSVGQLFLSGGACNMVGQTQYNWGEALQQAEMLNASGGFAGFTDWRVPNRNELASLYEGGCLNDELFRSTFSGDYWSSTPVLNNTGLPLTGVSKAWYGRSFGERTENHYVRLVRTVIITP